MIHSLKPRVLDTEAEVWLRERGFLASGTEQYTLRRSYIDRYGFAIPSMEAIEALAALSPLLEVGSGSGYWAYEIQKAGGDCVATDNGSYRSLAASKGIHVWQPYTEILRLLGSKAARGHPSHTLLMVWPDYNKPWPSETLAAYTGNTVAYVGEGSGGCTGDKRFHEILSEQFGVCKLISIPQFTGVYDRLVIYERNPISASPLKEALP